MKNVEFGHNRTSKNYSLLPSINVILNYGYNPQRNNHRHTKNIGIHFSFWTFHRWVSIEVRPNLYY